MINMILSRLLWALGRKFDGYKTLIGGVGFIVLGILGIIRMIFPDMTQLPDLTIEASLGLISGGLTALGLAGKTEKQTAAIREQTVAVEAGNRLIADIPTRTILQPSVSPKSDGQ